MAYSYNCNMSLAENLLLGWYSLSSYFFHFKSNKSLRISKLQWGLNLGKLLYDCNNLC